MPQPKSKSSVGLGNTLMNDRFGKGNGADRKKTSAVVRTIHNTGEKYVVNDKQEASWVKMRSVTEQGALDEFLATAELAGTDFTAEKINNVKIIHTDHKNPYLLSATEEQAILGKHKANKARLTVPRRPKWNAETTAEELDVLEREAFLGWRRGLAELQESDDLLMTPFERNLEVWRQLWRVIERSDLVVQIVDARNPLLFRSEDLESYVKDVDPRKENLLLINKADMMTDKQRKAWTTYLKGAGIAYRFFSASLAKAMIEAREEGEFSIPQEGGEDDDSAEEEEEASPQVPEDDASEDEEEDASSQVPEEEHVGEKEGEASAHVTVENQGQENTESEAVEVDEDIRILTVEELEEIFLTHAPAASASDPDHKMQIGLVGYPNVGKSSTINALIGSKKVSVSATPGKTKHFQTIHLSEKVVLCDCPGLVFPNFATTKADLVCNGILPIDQLREFTGPATLVAQRIPQPFIEAMYGFQIRLRPREEGGTGIPTGPELLAAYAKARGFQTQGVGIPDESRAARYVLKDYVNGKLLYCAPPPGDYDPREFNKDLYDESHLPEKRRAALAAAMDAMPSANDDSGSPMPDSVALPAGPKSRHLDAGFFKGTGRGGHAAQPFHYQYSEQGRNLSGRKARTVVAMELGVEPEDLVVGTSKKHFKGGPRGKKKAAESFD